MRSIKLLISLLSLAIFSTGCFFGLKPRPPASIEASKVPHYAWETVIKQRSFRFTYSVAKKSANFLIKGKGTVILPDALRFKGIWQMGDDVRALDIAVAGDYQLENLDGQWIPRQRSEEAKIVEQADRVIRKALIRKDGKAFKLILDDGKKLVYSFKPNLIYLDPGFTKRFHAELVVDRLYLLAEEIRAASDDSDVVFNFTISALNAPRKINIPFAKNFRISYYLEQGYRCKAKRALRARLNYLGRDVKFETDNLNIKAYLALPVDEVISKELGKPGDLVILGLNLDGDGQRINTKGQNTDIFRIADTLARPRVHSVGVAYDSLSRPVLELKLIASEPKSRNYDYLGVAVDGVLYEVFPVDKPTNVIRIANINTYQEAIALAAKLNKPYKGRLRFIKQENLR